MSSRGIHFKRYQSTNIPATNMFKPRQNITKRSKDLGNGR